LPWCAFGALQRYVQCLRASGLVGSSHQANGTPQIIVVSLECFPIEAIWEVFDPDNPLDPSEYHCGVDIHKFFLGNAIPNIITDIFIMVLPLPYILKLHLRVSQKVALFGIFVVGTL